MRRWCVSRWHEFHCTIHITKVVMADESLKRRLPDAPVSDPTTDIDNDWLLDDDEPGPGAASILAPTDSAAASAPPESLQDSGEAPHTPRAVPPPLPASLPSTSPVSSPPPSSSLARASGVVARADVEDLESDAPVTDEADAAAQLARPPSATELRQPVIPRAPRIPGPADLPGPLIPELDVEEIKAALALRRSRE